MAATAALVAHNRRPCLATCGCVRHIAAWSMSCACGCGYAARRLGTDYEGHGAIEAPGGPKGARAWGAKAPGAFSTISKAHTLASFAIQV